MEGLTGAASHGQGVARMSTALVQYRVLKAMHQLHSAPVTML